MKIILNLFCPHQLSAELQLKLAQSDYWVKYVGLEGAVIGIDKFGESAPGEILMEHFGFTTENVMKVAKSVL